MSNHVGHNLSDEEKYKVTLQVDHFIEILSARYGIDPTEVIEAVRWVRERKRFTDTIKNVTTFSIIGVLISALFLALWQGLNHLIGNGK